MQTASTWQPALERALSDRQRHFQLLDALRDTSNSHTFITETNGERDSLLVYCRLHSIMVDVRAEGEQSVWRAVMPGGAVVEVRT